MSVAIDPQELRHELTLRADRADGRWPITREREFACAVLQVPVGDPPDFRRSAVGEAPDNATATVVLLEAEGLAR